MQLEELVKYPQEMEKAEWKSVLDTLVEARKQLCKDGVNHTWMDGAIGIAKERSEGKGTYAATTAAPPDINLSADNWAAVFHTAFRHAGFSEQAANAHYAIESMENREWTNIVDYMLIGIRRKLNISQW